MATTYGWFKESHDKVKDTFEYKLAKLEMSFTERILEIMEEKGVSRAELARRLRVSGAAVSKLFNKPANITLKRALSLAEALSCEVNVAVVDVEQFRHKTDITYNLKNDTGLRFELRKFDLPDDYHLIPQQEEQLYAVDAA